MTSDGCLARLKSLIEVKGNDSLELATMHIDEFVAEGEDRQAMVQQLDTLRTSLRRETATSPLREDISDAIGSKILRLLELN